MVLTTRTKPAVFDSTYTEISAPRCKVVGNGVPMRRALWVSPNMGISRIPATYAEVSATTLESWLVFLIVFLATIQHVG